VSAVNVSVLVWPGDIEDGFREAVMPEGMPDVAKDTAPVMSPLGMMVTVAAVEVPCAMVDGMGAMSIAKYGYITSRPSGAVTLRLPEVPVTVKIEA